MQALIILAGIGLLVVAGFGIAAQNWRWTTRQLQIRLTASRRPVDPSTCSTADLGSLPPPVQRYLRTVLPDGQPMITALTLHHRGHFNLSETSQQWKLFTSQQWVTTQRPGFIWDARIAMGRGITVYVHDAYIAGTGILSAKLFGFLTVMDQPPTPELAQGELMRFLAEAAWYPTVLLPGQGVEWSPIDDHQASATLTDGHVSVTLQVQFDDYGLIHTIGTDARYRLVNDAPVPTPWQGRFWDYQRHHGLLVPQRGEVAWLLPDGLHPYWQGCIHRIDYSFH